MTTSRRVLHFSATDNEGGSGRSAYRIHNGLKDLGWQSRMLVGLQVTHDADVQTVHGGGRLTRVAGRWVDKASRQFGFAYQWQIWGGRLAKHPWLGETDIIQLFNLHGGYFPIRLLPVLSRFAPLVWRLSDMWPMTGHCVYSGDCERWKIGCGECPKTNDYVELGIDTTAYLWQQKASLYKSCDITVVAPSSWTERLALESPLLGQFPVHRIPNGIDVNVFRPIARHIACDAFGYDQRILRILFVAHGLDNNPRKGGDALMRALHHLGATPNVELVLAGVGGESWQQAGLPIPMRLAGYIQNDQQMAMLYSCADLIVTPSAMENLPNTLLEAMACGLPAVAVKSGGIADAVHEGINGYLVDQGDYESLALRIAMLLENASLRHKMGLASRQLIESDFSYAIQAQRFSSLYEHIIDQRKGVEA